MSKKGLHVSPKVLYVYSYQSTRHQIPEEGVIYYYRHDKPITEVVTYGARETKLNGRFHTQPASYPLARMLVGSQISNKPIGALLYNAKSIALLRIIYKTSTPVLISHDRHYRTDKSGLNFSHFIAFCFHRGTVDAENVTRLKTSKFENKLWQQNSISESGSSDYKFSFS